MDKLKGIAFEVPQDQYPININRLRKKYGLKPITGGDKDFIPIE